MNVLAELGTTILNTVRDVIPIAVIIFGDRAQ